MPEWPWKDYYQFYKNKNVHPSRIEGIWKEAPSNANDKARRSTDDAIISRATWLTTLVRSFLFAPPAAPAPAKRERRQVNSPPIVVQYREELPFVRCLHGSLTRVTQATQRPPSHTRLPYYTRDSD